MAIKCDTEAGQNMLLVFFLSGATSYRIHVQPPHYPIKPTSWTYISRADWDDTQFLLYPTCWCNLSRPTSYRIHVHCSTPHAEWAVREVLCSFLIGDNCIWANVRFQNIDVFCIFVDGSVSSFHLAQNIFDFFFPPSLLILEKMWNWEVFQYQFAVTPGERCQFRHASLSKFPGIAP